MKLISSILLTALCAVLGFGQAQAQNAKSFGKDGLRYTVLQNHEVSVAYNDEDTIFLRGRVVIPSQVVNPADQQTYTVTALADTAFKRCNLIESIVLPSTLASVGRNICDHCFNLVSYEIPAGAQNYCTIDGILYNAAKTEVVSCPAGLSGNYTMPAGVVSMAPTAFATCKNLKQVAIAEGLKVIPDYAFYECWGLAQIQFPESLESIGDYAFDGTILQFLLFHKNLKSIGSHAFERSSMVECMMLGSVPPSLGDDVFGNDMKYTRLYVPSGSQGKYKATRWNIFPTIYQGNKTRRWAGSYR